ncbi:MAG: GerMN domain-containing protein [Gloeomargaritaceae cyanobacterium C42_A2020_066]|nr:GerMN domain-containing protein [Gloeomargaritaceae cyanobacterium C42_A2020_066]
MGQYPMRRRIKTFPLGLAIVAAVGLGAVGSGAILWLRQGTTSLSTPLSIQTQTPQVYWIAAGPELTLTAQKLEVPKGQSPEVTLTSAFNRLLANPPGNTASAIPQGTRLLGLKLKGQKVYVDLSSEFQRGGGSASMIHRVAQVLYTATSLNPKAEVYLTVAGRPVKALGGEGVELDTPTTRQRFAQDFDLTLPAN